MSVVHVQLLEDDLVEAAPEAGACFTPGGMAEANEPPHEAVRRELKEELGLDLHVGALPVVDWVSPHGPWDDLLAFVFDGGELSEEQIAGLKLRDGELSAFEFCTREQAQQRLPPYV